MLDFLLRLFVSTIKFAFRVFMILGGAVFSGLGNAALAIFSHSEDNAQESVMSTTMNSPEAELGSGDIDVFELKAIHDRYRDIYGN